MMFAKELKRLVNNPIFIILLCFIALTRWLVIFAAENDFSVFNQEHDYYADSYIDKISSLPIEKEFDVLEEEYQRFKQYNEENQALQEAFANGESDKYTNAEMNQIFSNVSYVSERLVGLMQVMERASALKAIKENTHIDVSVIHERGLLQLVSLFLFDAVPIGLLALLLPSFLIDLRTGMKKLILSTKNGAALLLRARLKTAAVISLFLFVFGTICDFIAVFSVEPLKDLNKPIQCLELFQNFQPRMSIIAVILVSYALKFIVDIIIAEIAALLTSGPKYLFLGGKH